MKLLELGKNVFVIKGFVNIGVIANDLGDALLVDAGLDERVASRVKIALDENGLKIKGVIITHAHADHYGGAGYFAENSGVRIYSSELEKGVLENPIVESTCLFGGAYPPAELRRKYFNAPKVAVHGTVSPGEAEIEGFPLEIVDLSGHTIGQIGVATGQVLFCADSVATPGQIQKQGILKNASIELSLKTCERLKSRTDLIFVPAHGNVLNDIKASATGTHELITQMLSLILTMTGEPIGMEDLLARIAQKNALRIKSLSQYYVLHLSVLAHLGCLMDRTQISVLYCGNHQLFQRRSAAEPEVPVL